MSLVRVSFLPTKITERDLKIHFGKPENGGGTIKNIIFPLFDRDAVIEFEGEHTAEIVCRHDHSINNETLFLKPLPVIQAYSTLTAKVDPTINGLLLSTDEILDEIKHIGNLIYHFDENSNQATLTGNWYQLEWAWAKIDGFMKHQKGLQERISVKMNRDRETSTLLPKGITRIIGDQDSPIISMPNSSKDGKNDQINDDDDDDDDDNDVKVIAGGSLHHMKKSSGSIKVPKCDNTSKTNFQDESELNVETDSIEHIIRATAELGIHDKHVTFKEGQGDQASVQRHRDLKATYILDDKPNDVRSLEFEHHKLVVNIFTGEITLAETDVIVNAAMGPLINAGGVAKAIAWAASPEMQRQCDEYVSQNGSLGISGVMHTCAGGSLNEKVKHILHAVGPVWSSGADEGACRFQLTRTFLNCFNYGNNHLKVTSMTLPVISSGIFGCPLEVCVRAFVDAILLFTLEHEGESLVLKEVHLINNNSDNTALTVIQVRHLIGQGFETLTSEATNFFRKMKDIEAASKVQMKTEPQYSREGTSHRTRTGPSGPSSVAGGLHRKDYKSDMSQPRTAGRPLPAVPTTGVKIKDKK